MTRIVSLVVMSLLVVPVAKADSRNCNMAYRHFLQRIQDRADTLSGDRLAFLHRHGLRIFDACDTGHLNDPDLRLHALEQS